ncbi:MAG: hypothetical protein OQK32_03435 [Gammaproteobacteria bacterium]|nr:hypothetical protein [Gammaproteobacteria bacterium]
MPDLRQLQEKFQLMGLGPLPTTAKDQALRQAGYLVPGNSEIGSRATPENRIKHMQRLMYVDPTLRAAILDLRHMDRIDGRVKKIHNKMARTAVKGGLKLVNPSENKRLERSWKAFKQRLNLHKQEKLESDGRGLAMEGNLPMQWVLNKQRQVIAGIRMPTETIKPVVTENGMFKDANNAYEQYDLLTGKVIASFPLWNLTMVRLSPDNFDDMGCMGRPYLDASRDVWQKLTHTEENLVIRRWERAPLRTAHVLEGADEADLLQYKQRVEDDQKDGSTNYYLNKKGAVTAIQGDANLDQINDVVYLLDTFFAGSPAPKGLFGYSGDLNRDILEDLKKDFFEEIDALQDTQSSVYYLGFRLQLLLDGIIPDSIEFDVQFAERKTMTDNQRADLALKHQALGAGARMAWKTAGLDVSEVLAAKKIEQNSHDPYPEEGAGGGGDVKITPGNAPKNESSTSVTNN